MRLSATVEGMWWATRVAELRRRCAGRAPAERSAAELSALRVRLAERAGEVLALADQPRGPRGEPRDERLLELTQALTDAVCANLDGEQQLPALQERCEHLFAALAQSSARPLPELVGGLLRWRDAASRVVSELAGQLGVGERVRARGCNAVAGTADGALIGLCEAFDGERRRQRERLTFLATHDPLTGLANRTLLERRLGGGPRGPVTLLFVDVDDFKRVNDTLGHGAGDELLCTIAQRLRATVRDGAAIARLGGDEFVIVVDDEAQASPAALAERTLRAFADPFVLAGGCASFRVTASVGVASGVHLSAEQLLRKADLAMYRAKGAGKNAYALAPGC